MGLSILLAIEAMDGGIFIATLMGRLNISVQWKQKLENLSGYLESLFMRFLMKKSSLPTTPWENGN